jgi:vancomycin resistance protein YoaR
MKRLRWLAVPAAAVLVAGGGFLGFLADGATVEGRVGRGVRAAGVALSGLDREGVVEALRPYEARLARAPVVVRVGGRATTVELATAGLGLDLGAVADAALAEGRRGSVVTQFGAWARRAIWPTSLPLRVSVDEAALERGLDAIERVVADEAPSPGAIVLRSGELAVDPPRSGRALDRGEARRRLVDLMRTGERQVELALRQIDAPHDAIELLVDRVEPGLRLEASTLARALRSRASHDPVAALELGFDAAELMAAVEPERARLERGPEDARFVVDEQDHVSILAGRSGTRLDAARLAQAALVAASSPSRSAPLPFADGAAPALGLEEAQRLKVDGLVATYTSRFQCCQPRVKNIERIAGMLDGVMLLPGQRLSVNERIGPRTEENGFVLAPSIDMGEMVETFGGGVSQFATTLFNALFQGGYDIIERAPHSLYFARYPVGYDATLSWPKPDLIFRNDTDAALLIKTALTKTSVTVKLFGNNGGRTITAEVSERRKLVEPAIELLPNARLAPDDEKVKEQGQPGWTVVVARVLTLPDGTVKREPREVTYKPRTRRVEVHPCRIPPDEEGHTGEPCPEPTGSPDAGVEPDAHAAR